MSLKFGVIGRRFGRNYIRTIQEELPHLAEVVAVCSQNIENAEFGVKYFTQDYRVLCANADIDTVIVAAPAHFHLEMVECALLYNKNVICEKPFTLDSHQAIALNTYAKSQGLNLLINHIDLFNPGYRLVKAKIKQPTFLEYPIGGIVKREDCNALWDYLVHPLAVALDIFETEPEIIEAEGDDDAAGVKLRFGEAYARLNCSRIIPNKRRMLDLWSKDHHCYFDMISNEVWNNASDEWELLEYDKTLPLTVLLTEFCAAVEAKEVRFNADLGVKVVKLLEEIDGRLKS